MIKRKKGMTAIMEYILVSMLSIFFVISVLVVFYIAKNIAYKLSFEMQSENLAKKFSIYEKTLVEHNLINSSFYFEIPKYFNGDPYLLIFKNKKVIFKNSEKGYLYEHDLPCHHPTTYLYSTAERFYVIYNGSACLYKVANYG